MKKLLFLGLCLMPGVASGQARPSGYVSIFGDYVPNRDSTAELRSRLFAEEVLDPTPKLLITGSAFVEGLVANRQQKTATDAIFHVQELSVGFHGERFDILAGFGTIAWGRLDELEPTDVINPLDVSRFFFEGRSEARMPVGLARARLIFSERASLEAVYVPFFRRGRFDQLDEPTSPFNIARLAPDEPTGTPPDITAPPVSVTEHAPSSSLRNSQGGVRFNATTRRVDWSLSAYSGIEPFGLYQARPPSSSPAVIPVDLIYPRFKMIGGDFETVHGPWGVRGEVAAFVRDTFQSPLIAAVEGQSLDAGVGVDRKAGGYRISGTVMLHREWYDESIDGVAGRSDVSVILSTDRSLARERYRLRGFGVYNPSERSAFLRAIATAKLSDDLALEGSGGWFAGDGRDLVGRFADSDFVYLRLKYDF